MGGSTGKHTSCRFGLPVLGFLFDNVFDFVSVRIFLIVIVVYLFFPILVDVVVFPICKVIISLVLILVKILN